MPELPEVETTKRGLEPLIVDRKIISVHIYKKKASLGNPQTSYSYLKKSNHPENIETCKIFTN